MAIVKKGTGFAAQFMLNGVRFYRLLPTRDLARSWETEVRQRVRRGEEAQAVQRSFASEVNAAPPAVLIPANPKPPITSEDAPVTMQQAYEMAVLHYQRQKDAKGSLSNCLMAVKFFGPDTPVRSIKARQRDAYIAFLFNEKKLKEGTVNRKMSALSMMCSFVMEVEPDLPFKRKGFKEGEGRSKIFTIAEQHLMLEQVVQREGVEWWRFVLLLFETGLRAGEMQKLRSNWLMEKADGSIELVVHGKDSKNKSSRTLPLTGLAATVIREQLGEGHATFWPRKFLYEGSPSKMFKRVRVDLRTDEDAEYVLHTIRHTVATRLLERTGNVFLVQQWLGHKSIKTTEKYMKLTSTMLSQGAEALSGYAAVNPAAKNVVIPARFTTGGSL